MARFPFEWRTCAFALCCLLLAVPLQSATPSCKGALHTIEVSVDAGSAPLKPYALKVQKGDCIRLRANGKTLSVKQIQFERPDRPSRTARIIERPSGCKSGKECPVTVPIAIGDNPGTVVIRSPGGAMNPKGVIIQCPPPICRPDPQITVFFGP